MRGRSLLGRRRRGLTPAAVAAAAFALALAAGCGEEEAPTTRGPSDARFEVGDPSRAAAATTPAECPSGGRPSLDAADRRVGVADVEERRDAAPTTLVTADDLTLECVRWSSWGGARAEGEGVARLLVCRPSCANGTEDRVPARVVLTNARECSGRRWYLDARVVLERKDLGEPASYLRNPC